MFLVSSLQTHVTQFLNIHQKQRDVEEHKNGSLINRSHRKQHGQILYILRGNTTCTMHLTDVLSSKVHVQLTHINMAIF